MFGGISCFFSEKNVNLVGKNLKINHFEGILLP